MEDIEKTPTNKLVIEMTLMDKEIDLLLYKYELIRLELIRRFPDLENSEEFKPKERKK